MKRIVVASLAKDQPISQENFKVEEVDPPSDAPEGGVLAKTLFLSVDPYMSNRMRSTFGSPWKLNESPTGGGVCQVINSKNSEWKEGEYFVTSSCPWQEISSFSSNQLQSFCKLSGKFPLSYYLGILGMPGLTAYFGVTDICQPKKGETLLVNGASGAVGIAVGQIAKIMGCRVIGITGSDEKASILTKEFHFDLCLNYRKYDDLSKTIQESLPEGIDCFFDNVGGPLFDAVIKNINKGARIAICGAISQYGGEYQTGPRPNIDLLTKGACMKGFHVYDYKDKFDEALKKMEGWIEEGQLKSKEDILEGIQRTPEALVKILKCGEKFGKQIVRVSQVISK